MTPEPQPEVAPVDGDQALDALAEWRTSHAPRLRRQAQQLREVLMAADCVRGICPGRAVDNQRYQ